MLKEYINAYFEVVNQFDYTLKKVIKLLLLLYKLKQVRNE